MDELMNGKIFTQILHHSLSLTKMDEHNFFRNVHKVCYNRMDECVRELCDGSVTWLLEGLTLSIEISSDR